MPIQVWRPNTCKCVILTDGGPDGTPENLLAVGPCADHDGNNWHDAYQACVAENVGVNKAIAQVADVVGPVNIEAITVSWLPVDKGPRVFALEVKPALTDEHRAALEKASPGLAKAVK